MDEKYTLAWLIYKYVRYKPELVKNEKIADVLLKATKYLCAHIRSISSYNTFQEIISYLNTNADKENALKIEDVTFNETIYSKFK